MTCTEKDERLVFYENDPCLIIDQTAHQRTKGPIQYYKVSRKNGGTLSQLPQPSRATTAILFLAFSSHFCIASSSVTSTILDASSLSDGVHTYTVTATSGSTAQLPCNITANSNNDSVRLILWYKESIKGGPIYSLDSRHHPLTSGRHFSALTSFASRASFSIHSSPALLTIDQLDLDDSGEYKCRVDFRKGRTSISIVNLSVIVPPKKLYILDNNGDNLVAKTHPVNEGSNLKVICQSVGGFPTPDLKWYHDDREIDSSFDIDAKDNRTVTNELILIGVPRNFYQSTLSCQASHVTYSYAVNVSILIDINLKPLTVEISTKNQKTLIAGRRTDITCSTSGSRPPAILTWFMNKRRLTQLRESISSDGNTTTSILSLVPSAEDNGATLLCKSENIRFPGFNIEHRQSMDVYYEPQVSLLLNTEDGLVREANDIRLECLANGRPKVFNYQWKFNDGPLETDNARVILNESLLLIKSIRKEDKGRYKCIVSNEIGKADSNELLLHIHHPPFCRPNQKLVYGVGLGETARILCDIDSLPADNVKFKWTMNDSLVDLASKFQTNSDQSRSSLLYTPFSRYDYGSVRCWATNAAGSMANPCLFTIVPAGRPEAPRDCLVSAVSENQFAISCTPGYDGGLETKYILEVYDKSDQSSTLISNITSSNPSFDKISNLSPATKYTLIVYSANLRGRSEKSILLSLTTRSPSVLIAGERSVEVETEKKRGEDIWLQATITSLIILFLVMLLILIMRFNKNRKIRRLQRKRLKELNSSQDKDGDKEMQVHFHSNDRTQETVPGLFNHHVASLKGKGANLDKGPDIIPFNRFPLRVLVTSSLDPSDEDSLYSGSFSGQYAYKTTPIVICGPETDAAGGLAVGSLWSVPSKSTSPYEDTTAYFPVNLASSQCSPLDYSGLANQRTMMLSNLSRPEVTDDMGYETFSATTATQV